MCAKKATKNLLVKTDKSLVDNFKICSFTYYKDNDLLSLFSYRHYLCVTLLNVQKSFQQKYHKVTAPNEQYLVFYKKRGTKIENTKEERILESINFLLPLKYSDLYYELMHTYYINEKSDSSSYSISAFFEFLVSFVSKNPLEFFSVEL
ncbi:hypothetical protein [Chryseobacterium aquaticum]|uniref:Uncharacterized protein n=2 Tax=Chryseobacterium TaxID=59732 RepID=A0A101CHT9_9FLAO|nr:hypothetical protein [Chryseobacterium aquaticum]KUJ56417.1 hypothetical protein AR686_07600 [Chryseobacterium aquaticum subsp. greenlandense]